MNTVITKSYLINVSLLKYNKAKDVNRLSYDINTDIL